MQRRTTFAEGEYYHVYNRGAHKLPIFNEEADYDRFQLLLYLCNDSSPLDFRVLASNYKGRSFVEMYTYEKRERDLVDVLAYSLMPNHYHLVLREKTENGIVRFLRKVATGYSMYFNKKNEHSGVLFQGRFKSKHIDNEAYFRWIFSYVHLNPSELVSTDWENRISEKGHMLRKFIEKYKYSSFPDYSIGARPEKIILTDVDVPDFLSNQNDLDSLIVSFTKDRPL